MKLNQNIPTSAISFVETEHGRLRRQQRAIAKKDLQRAKKYGSKKYSHRRPNGDPVAIYTYEDIVYITNDVTGEEVTSYAIPIDIDLVPISIEMKEEYTRSKQIIQEEKSKWKSNTCIVVDTSGSMRKSDVWGTRTRLDAVWLSVALDFIATRIESGAASSLDVVSIISLGPTATFIASQEPTSWILYNKIIEYYKEKTISPKSHGNYIPSLDLAEQVLLENSNGSCAMGLCFISDGKPSDFHHDQIYDKVCAIAKKFGRRLQFDAVGIGDSDDFVTLELMVHAAEEYHCKASMSLPSMSSSDLGVVFQTFATSMTSTQTEMTDLLTFKQRNVRNISRESRSKARQIISTVSADDFYMYNQNAVKRLVYKEWKEGKKCRYDFVEVPLQHQNAKCVAMNKEAFGEGGERFAYRFYELSEDMTSIVGNPMVAKESRFVLEKGIADEKERKKFALSFCRTQQLARRIAEEFNTKMNEIAMIDSKTPKIKFLDCSIYRLGDNNLGNLSVLVEDRIDHHEWYKWNSNNGFVEGMQHVPTFDDTCFNKATLGLNNLDIGMIEEGDEEDEDDSSVESFNHSENKKFSPIIFTPSEVAQAFSHFSYWATGRKRLICDLQGVYDKEENTLILSDPVIHYRNVNKSTCKPCKHGRTDRGSKGMWMFFATHKDYCCKLCRLVTRGFKEKRKSHHRK